MNGLIVVVILFGVLLLVAKISNYRDNGGVKGVPKILGNSKKIKILNGHGNTQAVLFTEDKVVSFYKKSGYVNYNVNDIKSIDLILGDTFGGGIHVLIRLFGYDYKVVLHKSAKDISSEDLARIQSKFIHWKSSAFSLMTDNKKITGDLRVNRV